MNKKTLIQTLCIILFFIVLAYGFVPQVLGGKIVNQSDISGWQGMSHEMMEWNKEHPDDQTAWTESMFGGMPTTTIHASTKGDLTQYFYDFLTTFGKRPATYLFISLLGAWLLMLSFGVSPLIAIGGAIAVTFCSYNLQIIQVGHNTKMQAIAFFPWVLAALAYVWNFAIKKERWLPYTALGAALFGMALNFQIKANHPQITYYLALVVLIYSIVMIVWYLRDAKRRATINRFLISCGLLLVMGCAGIATNAIKLLPTYEYTPYSMRGGNPDANGGATKGLDMDYATAWSYGWEEIPNLLIPNFNGGSSSGAVNPRKSETYSLLKKAGQPNLKEVSKALPLYWGPQPFTAGPMYMGAVTIFLFMLALLCYKGKDKWWILATCILSILLALGSHLMWFTKFFYNYVPLYNKFRTVSMAMVILQICLPLLAFIFLDRMVKDNDAAQAFKKKGWIALAVTGGFCLLCLLIPGLAGNFRGAADASLPDVLSDALADDRRGMLKADALRSLLLILGAYLLLLWSCTSPKSAAKTFATQPQMGQARRRTAALLVSLLILLDLFPLDKRYLNSDHFVTQKDFLGQFDKRPVDELILEDKDLSYRVVDLTVDPFNDSHPSYWHKNVGGYSPAKLRNYQTFIENTLQKELGTIASAISGCKTIDEAEAKLPYLEGLATMNCRYIIVGEDMAPIRYQYAKGNAWFADNAAGQAEMTSYAPNELHYKYTSETGGELVFSEVYYPKGWTLTLDGTDIIPMNQSGEILRCAKVPAGEHTLVMRFDPPSYRIGEKISLISSILLFAIFLASIAVAAYPYHKRTYSVEENGNNRS